MTLSVVPDPRDPLAFGEDERSELVRLLDLVGRYLFLDDTAPILASLATATSAQLTTGKPLWLMLVGASSTGKTESVDLMSEVAHGHIGDCTAPGLLGWDARARRVTGLLAGLSGATFLTIRDFSSAMAGGSRRADSGRQLFFAALRDLYDGHWARQLGGIGRTLEWRGRLTLLAASTPSIDAFMSEETELGERWVYLRMPERSDEADRMVALHAPDVDREALKRLSQQFARNVIPRACARVERLRLSPTLSSLILDAAGVGARGRTPIRRESYGPRDILVAPSPEGATRLFGELRLLARCLLALGCEVEESLDLVYRCARDTMPPMRAKALRLLAEREPGLGVSASELAKKTFVSRPTAMRVLEDLGSLGLLQRDEDDQDRDVVTGQFETKPWFLNGMRADNIRRVFGEHPPLPSGIGFDVIGSYAGPPIE